MNVFAGAMNEPMSTDAPPIATDRAALSRTFSASDCLLAVIETALAARHPTLIEVPGLGTVWVDPQSRQYTATLLRPEEFFRSPSSAVQTTFDAARPTSAHFRPVEELLWLAGFHGSRGALLDRCHVLDIVELRCWPNLTRLMHTPGTMSFCALLMRRPTAISLVHRILHMQPQEALQIYSAATAAGLIRVVSTVHVHKNDPVQFQPSPVAQRVASFWGLMVKRIIGI